MSYDKEIQDYLEGRLSPGEETEFRKRLSADKKLKELYEAYLALNRHLADYYKRKQAGSTGKEEGQDLAEESIADYEMVQREKDFPSPETEQFSRRLRLIEGDFHAAYAQKGDLQRKRFIYWIAAALVVGIIGSYLLIFSHQDLEMRLFARYYEPGKLADFDYAAVRGDRNEQTLKFYEEGAYREMIFNYEEFGTEDPLIRFLTAHAYIKLEEYDQAKKILVSMTDDPGVLQDPVYWNLALLEIRDGEWERAASHLEELVRTGGTFAGRARNLLRKVSRQIE